MIINPYRFAVAGYGNDFAMRFTTTGASETLTIPCQNYGVFSATIDWGDGGATSSITTWNDADLSHVYADAGDYDVRISGTFPNIRFNSSGDRLKLKQIYQFGSVGLGNLANAFYGCTNLTSACTEPVNNVSAVLNMTYLFRDCTSLATLDASGWNTAAVTTMDFMFFHCSALTALDVSGFNTASVTTMHNMFNDCSTLTALDVSGFNTAIVNSMRNMFYLCSGITTLDVTGFNTSSVTTMEGMFYQATGLTDVAIDGFNIANVTTLTSFMNGLTLPTARYDATLIAWDAQVVKPSLTPNFGGSKYSTASPQTAAEIARASLVSGDSWTITDGGAA